MKYTIHGFNQEKAIKLGLDITDLIILRYFVDFKDTGKMVSKIINEEKYYWLKYDGVVESLPILKLKKDSVYRKLKNMVSLNVLKHETVKNKGIYSYFALGEKYITLIDDSVEGSENNPIPIGKKSGRGTENNPEQKINLLNNINLLNIYTEVFNFWNEKEIVKHKQLTTDMKKAIDKALKTYSKEEILEAIDNYNTILKDESYFFSYRWSLTDFLNRKNGISSFTEEGSKTVDYKSKHQANKPKKRKCTILA